MKKSKWKTRIIKRYILFQIPAFLIVISILLLLDQWLNLTYVLITAILVLWILKDTIMYRFVWKSYDVDNKAQVNRLIGSKGKIVEDLNPRGYVKVNGELWHAEVNNNDTFLRKDEVVEVVEVNGLKMRVKKSNDRLV